jgi:hypothetical protein
MQAMFKVPDNSISHPKTCVCKRGIQNGIERDNGSLVDKIPNLPANATFWRKNANAFSNDPLLLRDVLRKAQLILVFLANIVRGRSDDQVGAFVRQTGEKFLAIAEEKRDVIPGVIYGFD